MPDMYRAKYEQQLHRTQTLIDLMHYSTSWCDGCGQKVYWLLHRGSGAKTAYNHDGSNHHRTCVTPKDPKKNRQGVLL